MFAHRTQPDSGLAARLDVHTMTENASFEYVRPVDFAAFAAIAADQRHQQKLLDRTSGGDKVGVVLIRTPAGGGSPEGLHTHDFDQIFYVLEGVMAIEVDGQKFEVQPGSLVVFPQDVPHRNWTATDAPTLHLAINAPAPALGVKMAKPVR
jgi:quercetin dioxygenase-like cupin family protein